MTDFGSILLTMAKAQPRRRTDMAVFQPNPVLHLDNNKEGLVVPPFGLLGIGGLVGMRNFQKKKKARKSQEEAMDMENSMFRDR